MGKHTKPRQNKTTKFYNCKQCGKQISRTGSGRPITWCSSNCYKKYHYVPKTKKPNAETSFARNKRLVIADKIMRGECALHPQYHDGRRKFVTINNHLMFCYDHLDRQTKIKNVAKARGSSIVQLENEMNKCQLLCHNCHAMKTYEERDYVDALKTGLQQPSLFDNE